MRHRVMKEMDRIVKPVNSGPIRRRCLALSFRDRDRNGLQYDYLIADIGDK